MAIDYAALLGITAGLQVAKQTYDVAVEGATVGPHQFAGQPVPDGAILVRACSLCTEGFTYTSGGSFTTALQGEDLLVHYGTLQYFDSEDTFGVHPWPTIGAHLAELTIVGTTALTGKLTLWILYLLA